MAAFVKHDKGLLLSKLIQCDIAAAAKEHKLMSPRWHAALSSHRAKMLTWVLAASVACSVARRDSSRSLWLSSCLSATSSVCSSASCSLRTCNPIKVQNGHTDDEYVLAKLASTVSVQAGRDSRGQNQLQSSASHVVRTQHLRPKFVITKVSSNLSTLHSVQDNSDGCDNSEI